MRTIPILAVVVALGLSMLILGGLGVSDHFGDDGATGLEGEVEQQAGENESISPEEGDDGGFFSFVLGALGQMKDMFGLLLFLPSTLESFGVPAIVSRAVGHTVQLIITLGLVQIALQWEVR
jgi:hypothetical protein